MLILKFFEIVIAILVVMFVTVTMICRIGMAIVKESINDIFKGEENNE